MCGPRHWRTRMGLGLLVLAGLGWVAASAAAHEGHGAAKPAPADLIRSAGSGPWSQGKTWEGGQAPGAAARVQVQAGHEVVYDLNSETPIRSIHVAGTLRFATDRDTRLDVGLIKIQPGDDASENGFDCDVHIGAEGPKGPRPAVLIGTPAGPLPADKTARIRLTYFEALDKQSCPALVNCGGRLELHGAPLSRTWVKLGATAAAGDASVLLAEPVSGWRVGDRVLVTATKRGGFEMGSRRPGRGNRGSFSEVRFIQEIDGARVVLDKPLEHEHLGEGEYRGEVANLSRNVIVESADPDGVRGHTMYHYGSAGSVHYAEFRHLGKEGVLGRYSMHYHLVGNTMRGESVVGASIWDSHNRWLTIHGTNYLVVRDCVGFQSVGHGFFLEDGTEVFNVLDRNLAVQAFHGKRLPEQVFPNDNNDGAGFWWANSLNSFTRNVAVENDRYGFRFEATPSSRLSMTMNVMQPDGSLAETDIRTLPFVRFDDNETHSNGLYGVNLGEGVREVGPDPRRPFVMRNTKIWDIHYAFRPQSPSLLAENLHIHRAAYGVYHPNYDHHVYRNLYISQTSAEPFNRGHDDVSVQYGPLAVDGLTFSAIRQGGVPMIQLTEDNPTGTAVAHFRNVKVVDRQDNERRALVNRGGGPRRPPKTEQGVPVYLHDWYGAGKHAKVVSTAAKDLMSDGSDYRQDPPLTGDESRVAEVENVEFPNLLDPIDDLPPATIVTSIEAKNNQLVVRGVTHDNGEVESVYVNGRPAEILSVESGIVDWRAVIEPSKDGRVTAKAVDRAGNEEKLPHVVQTERRR